MIKVKIKHHFGSFSNAFQQNQMHLISQQTEISALAIEFIHIKNEIFHFVDHFIQRIFRRSLYAVRYNNLSRKRIARRSLLLAVTQLHRMNFRTFTMNLIVHRLNT